MKALPTPENSPHDRPSASGNRRSVCFITGTRAEFGLMRSTLHALARHPDVQLRLIATGMHLDRSRGYSLDQIRDQGWTIDRIVPWRAARAPQPADVSRCTGRAIARLTDALDSLSADVVLVVGDRVEALAGAVAGHLSGRIVAHVHGGDRAAGQVDDSLRHAISKLAHLHFPATRQSAERLIRLGEDRWRIHCVGSPGIDGIKTEAAPLTAVHSAIGPLKRRRYALLVLHPVDPSPAIEFHRARMIAASITRAGFEQVVIVHPNNDPGSDGIVRAWETFVDKAGFFIRPDVPRDLFLGLMRNAAVLVGNSSSGIIEAASFGTPVVDIGSRQRGRERGDNVAHIGYHAGQLTHLLSDLWNEGSPHRAPARNPYGTPGTGQRIANVLARLRMNERLLRKLIAY